MGFMELQRYSVGLECVFGTLHGVPGAFRSVSEAFQEITGELQVF